jgi:hypothetical protein
VTPAEATARHKFLRLAPNRAYDVAITGVPDDGGASWTSSFVDFRLGSIVLDMTAAGACRSPAEHPRCHQLMQWNTSPCCATHTELQVAGRVDTPAESL